MKRVARVYSPDVLSRIGAAIAPSAATDKKDNWKLGSNSWPGSKQTYRNAITASKFSARPRRKKNRPIRYSVNPPAARLTGADQPDTAAYTHAAAQAIRSA